jgi:hypothetical protein
VSVPSPSVSDPPRRSRILRPIRLSMFLLLILVIALGVALYAYRVREARLQDRIAIYRHFKIEGIFDALDLPIVTTYTDKATLNDALKDIKLRMTKNPKLPKIPNGIPMYVDPVGLQEVKKSMETPIRRPERADAMPLGEHLRRVLQPLGLDFVVKDGFLMITSKTLMDSNVDDPYLRYRDVLR